MACCIPPCLLLAATASRWLHPLQTLSFGLWQQLRCHGHGSRPQLAQQDSTLGALRPWAQEGKRRMAARPTAEDLEHFRSVSPIAHAEKVTAPLLFLLGAKDRRCAPATVQKPCQISIPPPVPSAAG